MSRAAIRLRQCPSARSAGASTGSVVHGGGPLPAPDRSGRGPSREPHCGRRGCNAVPEVASYVTVTNETGQPVLGLPSESFSLSENGVAARGRKWAPW